MARDEAMLELTAQRGQPTLRLYQWSQPCLSLGYFQQYKARAEHQASRQCDCLRRSSGGGAIVHHHELTYSYAVPVAATTRATADYYNAFHHSLIEVLQAGGVAAAIYEDTQTPAVSSSGSGDDSTSGDEPFLCFQRRSAVDIVAGGEKLLGSAQRRRRGALLQHGSLLLRRSSFAPELPGVFDVASAGSPLATWLEAAENGDVMVARFIDNWLPVLASHLGATLQAGDWSQTELAAASELSVSKFEQTTWTQKR